MEYFVKNKIQDPNILLDILQNKFPKFNDSVVKWQFKNETCTSELLEKKILDTYNNKKFKTDDYNKVDCFDWIDIFDESLKKIESKNKIPILLFSGGKDSTFIAHRLQKLKIKALYFSFAATNEEKKVITDLANKLKIEISFTKQKLEFLDLEHVLKNINEPCLDPAGLSVLLLYDICLFKKYNFSDVIFIDGMGNDLYMGHLPGKRELQKEFLQKIVCKTNLQNIISKNLWNSLGKIGDLLRPDYAAHFQGSTIKLNNYNEQISYFKKYADYKDVLLRRNLLRLHQDSGATNKTILYLNSINKTSKVYFPFLNSKLFDFYEKNEVMDYDFSLFTNKLSLRKYLNKELNFDKISKKKRIFYPTFFSFQLNYKQLELAKKISIPVNRLNIRQFNDYYLWSKYIINNDIIINN
ncbi:asparagine synthase-related protein [Candidatus Pelagibacter sp.]|nr:asparagine synthase-related protein [Candidatus Pelagibacter sp.]